MLLETVTSDTIRRSEDYKAWLVNAVSHLRGASAIFDAAQDKNSDYTGPEMKLPCLLLAGIGIELTLKANLLRQGMPLAEVKDYGHNLTSLWSDHRNASLRGYAFECMEIEWEFAVGYGRVPEDQHGSLNQREYVGYLSELSKIYSRDSGYALRYPSNDLSLLTPAPFLLVRSFLLVADSVLKNPAVLDYDVQD